jgi:hypothetical protein
MSLVGGTTVVPGLPTPEPHVDPSSTNKEDEAVTVVEMMLVEALRASAADEDADDQPAKQMTSHQAEGERDQVEDASHDNFTPRSRKEDHARASQAPVGELKAEMTLVRATRALEKRLVVDLKEPKPGAGRDDNDDGHDHGQDNHDQANHKP